MVGKSVQKQLDQAGSEHGSAPALKFGSPPDLDRATDWLDIVSASEIETLVSMTDAIEIVTAAMIRLSGGSISSPERWVERVAPNGLMALMPGSATDGAFGVKVLSLFTAGARKGSPGHQGMMLSFDRETGRPLSVIEASALTGLRTSAASAAATRAMARPDASSMALIGCGEQAIWHARALPLVRKIDTAYVWSRDHDRAHAFADKHLGHIARVVVSSTVEAAVAKADIITTLTHSSDPLLFGRWLRAGQHLNLIGSSRAAFREVDDETVMRSRFVADNLEHVLSQGGELRHALHAGLVDRNHIVGEIGEVLAGNIAGRTSADEITLYKSLGHVAQDLAVAEAIHQRLSREKGACRIAW
jgi:ornithine cyclodeaminase/alanine dehydrogenase-like protein (mu-crystallin family)